ncbi:HNH endonuclease [Cystobacter fuscus]
MLEARPGLLVARHSVPHREPVGLNRTEFEQAMAWLAADMPGVPAPFLSRLDLKWAPSGARAAQGGLIRDHQRRCAQGGRSSNCLSLRRTDLHLDEDERTDMALMLAFESLWPGVEAVVKASVDPDQLRVAVFTSLSLYLGLLLLPEPTSKLVAVSMTGVLLAYLGAETLFNLVEGYRQLRASAQRARSFAELKAAGERYGRIMGERVGQVLIMAATAAVGWGSHMTTKGPGLPGFGRAAQFLSAETGLNLSRVASEVSAVMVAQPNITVALAPPAYYMASRGLGAGPSSRPLAAQPSFARLERVEEWRKPQFTEDGHVLPYKGTRNPQDPIFNLGRNRAGKTLTNGKDTIRFDKDGFAEFETRFETLIDESHIGSGRADLHFRAANKRLYEAIQADSSLARQLNLSAEKVALLPTSRKPPAGHTWHHHQDVGRMQLITDSAHDLAMPHTGGMAIWGGGY